MNSILKKLFLFIVGIVSIILSFKCFTYEKLDYASRNMYGGDAFTGIQNASAQTSNNIRELAEIEKFGFGSILLVFGLMSIGLGLPTTLKQKE